MDLKELLHSFFDKEIAGPLHDELYRLRQDVDRLSALMEGKPVVAPAPVEVPVVESTEPEAPSDQEAQETEADS